ncbi:DeoR/GlpR transcriptional regulator [Acidaminobacter sp. JC074]|uniref:DeoR/GlpR family DNA-binding transcription regulator n=1 Tax=Acidaminobacter sp. JC074 TaxID=2530199 RepID=UPI001F112C01|nr:DeoR/GlpR family DNA-binding transcription regulator [Acidaminobacter sp. JC074]MCH4887245.1 DeoR/GlpR transcriptional regulator [Acidaminobacter sp. JC074]
MRANERLDEIVKILNKQGRVHVKALSEMFQVTEDLIRKDLKKLEEKDLIDRIYGGAERKKKKFDASNVNYRMNIHRDHKMLIAEKALSIIENGDSIFLDASSTCAMIAEVLVKSHKELTVITNMLEIVRILEANNDIRCILVGGLYNRRIGGFVGIETIDLIKDYHVNKAFISCMSVRLDDQTLYSSTKDIGLTKTTILNQSSLKVLVTETRKFDYHGTVKFYNLSDLDCLICERPLSPQEENLINELGLNII